MLHETLQGVRHNIQRERQNTPHTKTTTSPQKNNKKCESPIFCLEKENNTEKSTLTGLHSGDPARHPLGQIGIETAKRAC